MTKRTNNPKLPAFLKSIEEKRVKSGITKYRIAKETGHTQQLVGEILKGDRNPSISTVMDILDQIGYELTTKPKKQ